MSTHDPAVLAAAYKMAARHDTGCDCEVCEAIRAPVPAAPAEVARVIWRKEPPTPMEAYECRWWWVRFVLDDGLVSWCEPRDLGAPTEYDAYCTRRPKKGHYEFTPCVLDGDTGARVTS